MNSQKELFEYYNERAPEYEEFYDGGHPVKIPDPTVIAEEIAIIKKLLPSYISGRCVDVACGTGYWLPVYEENCPEITLIDQSEKALYECNEKINRLGLEHKTEIIRGDIFDHKFDEGSFNSIFCGYLISHLTDYEIDNLMVMFKKVLVPGGRFVISDKVWSDTRQAVSDEKENMVTRTLKDGRKFKILNRMFEKPDLFYLAEKHNFELDIVYWGQVFFLVAGRFASV